MLSACIVDGNARNLTSTKDWLASLAERDMELVPADCHHFSREPFHGIGSVLRAVEQSAPSLEISEELRKCTSGRIYFEDHVIRLIQSEEQPLISALSSHLGHELFRRASLVDTIARAVGTISRRAGIAIWIPQLENLDSESRDVFCSLHTNKQNVPICIIRGYKPQLSIPTIGTCGLSAEAVVRESRSVFNHFEYDACFIAHDVDDAALCECVKHYSPFEDSRSSVGTQINMQQSPSTLLLYADVSFALGCFSTCIAYCMDVLNLPDNESYSLTPRAHALLAVSLHNFQFSTGDDPDLGLKIQFHCSKAVGDSFADTNALGYVNAVSVGRRQKRYKEGSDLAHLWIKSFNQSQYPRLFEVYQFAWYCNLQAFLCFVQNLYAEAIGHLEKGYQALYEMFLSPQMKYSVDIQIEVIGTLYSLCDNACWVLTEADIRDGWSTWFPRIIHISASVPHRFQRHEHYCLEYLLRKGSLTFASELFNQSLPNVADGIEALYSLRVLLQRGTIEYARGSLDASLQYFTHFDYIRGRFKDHRLVNSRSLLISRLCIRMSRPEDALTRLDRSESDGELRNGWPRICSTLLRGWAACLLNHRGWEHSIYSAIALATDSGDEITLLKVLGEAAMIFAQAGAVEARHVLETRSLVLLESLLAREPENSDIKTVSYAVVGAILSVQSSNQRMKLLIQLLPNVLDDVEGWWCCEAILDELESNVAELLQALHDDLMAFETLYEFLRKVQQRADCGAVARRIEAVLNGQFVQSLGRYEQ